MGKETNTEDKTAILNAELDLGPAVVTGVDEAEGDDTTVVTVVEATETKSDKPAKKLPFRKMKPNTPAAEVRKKPTPVKNKPVTKQKERAVTSNGSLIRFPSDRFGVTKDIKKAGLHAASRIAGNAEKKELVLAVIDIMVEHINLKFAADVAYRKKLDERKAAKDEKDK